MWHFFFIFNFLTRFKSYKPPFQNWGYPWSFSKWKIQSLKRKTLCDTDKEVHRGQSVVLTFIIWKKKKSLKLIKQASILRD